MALGKNGGVPGFRAIVVHAAPTLVDSTLIPMVLFSCALHTVGLHIAIWSLLGWSAFAVGRRLASGRRIPGVILLAAGGVVARAATMLVTGSTFLFFFQPVLGTVVTGMIFVVSVIAGRPLVEHLARDFVPLPSEVFARPSVRRLVTQLSVLWAAVHFANAGATMFLLQREPVSTFVLLRPVVSVSTTGVGIVVTVIAARRVLAAVSAAPEPVATVMAVPLPAVAGPAVAGPAVAGLAVAGLAVASAV